MFHLAVHQVLVLNDRIADIAAQTAKPTLGERLDPISLSNPHLRKWRHVFVALRQFFPARDKLCQSHPIHLQVVSSDLEDRTTDVRHTSTSESTHAYISLIKNYRSVI
jgi:hypothetical protein